MNTTRRGFLGMFTGLLAGFAGLWSSAPRIWHATWIDETPFDLGFGPDEYGPIESDADGYGRGRITATEIRASISAYEDYAGARARVMFEQINREIMESFKKTRI